MAWYIFAFLFLIGAVAGPWEFHGEELEIAANSSMNPSKSVLSCRIGSFRSWVDEYCGYAGDACDMMGVDIRCPSTMKWRECQTTSLDAKVSNACSKLAQIYNLILSMLILASFGTLIGIIFSCFNHSHHRGKMYYLVISMMVGAMLTTTIAIIAFPVAVPQLNNDLCESPSGTLHHNCKTLWGQKELVSGDITTRIFWGPLSWFFALTAVPLLFVAFVLKVMVASKEAKHDDYQLVSTSDSGHH